MSEDSKLPVDHTDALPKEQEKTLEQTGPRNYSRRDALQAMGKYSAYVGTAGVVVLSAEDAVAQSALESCIEGCFELEPGGGRIWRCLLQCLEEGD